MFGSCPSAVFPLTLSCARADTSFEGCHERTRVRPARAAHRPPDHGVGIAARAARQRVRDQRARRARRRPARSDAARPGRQARDRRAAAPARPARSRRHSSRRASPRARASPASSPPVISFRSSTSRSPTVDRRPPTASSRSTCSSASSRSRMRLRRRRAARVAIADPANVHGIDELRLATRHPVELARRRAGGHPRSSSASSRARRRRSAPGSRSSRTRTQCCSRRRTQTDLEARRRHLRRAARPARQLGASSRRPRTARSDVHFEPQEDSLVVRFRIDGVLQEVQRIPKRLVAGRDHAPEGAREARHRRAAQAAGRPHLAQRGGRRPHARHPRRDAADGRGRVGRHAPPRQVAASAPTLAELGLSEEMRERMSRARQAPDRRAARHRPDRLRQVDDALRRAEPRSTGPRSTSSRSRTRSSTGSPASTRCRSTRAPG